MHTLDMKKERKKKKNYQVISNEISNNKVCIFEGYIICFYSVF